MSQRTNSMFTRIVFCEGQVEGRTVTGLCICISDSDSEYMPALRQRVTEGQPVKSENNRDDNWKKVEKNPRKNVKESSSKTKLRTPISVRNVEQNIK